MLGRTELIPVYDGERRRIGPFDCEFIPVTHSVPHAFATAYHTPVGTILHTRRLQARPHARSTAARPTSPLIGEIARRSGGVQLLLSDSTNAERPGLHAVGDDRRRHACGRLFRDYPDRRFIVASLRVAPAPRAAGRAKRRSTRGRQDRVPRPVDGAQRRARPRDGPARRPDRPRHRHRRGATLRAGRGLRHLHRIAGRADERAGAHGRARAQVRQGERGRRRRDLGARDPGQRVERLACHRLAAPRRRRGDPRRQRGACTCRGTRRRKS